MSVEPLRVGVIMDPIEAIKPQKDSTLAMLLAAARRGWRLYYMQLDDLQLVDGQASATVRQLEVQDDTRRWWSLSDPDHIPLNQLDVILMRKDPPFDIEYVFTTYILERAALDGVLVVNDPRSLRDISEKAFTAWFPELCPATMIGRDMERLREFALRYERAVAKPLDGMGGKSIFMMSREDQNNSVILETLTDHGKRFTVLQEYIPEIAEEGDTRVLLIDGKAVPYGLARIPAKGELRGNLAAGGRGVGRPLTDAEFAICARVGPELKARGILFAGLDVIGGKLTEINVTSPTCIRELDAQFGLDIAGDLMQVIAERRGLAPA
ncbi:MAG: glutathione synthase [Pseudomonadota bacterium]